jgi:hypothetical protein
VWHISGANRPKFNLSITCLVVVIVLMQITRHTLLYVETLLPLQYGEWFDAMALFLWGLQLVPALLTE